MRTFTAATLAALVDTVVRPFYLVSLALKSSTVYYSTLGHDVTWGGQTWLGNGFIKDLSSIRETGDLSADGMEIDLCGEPSALVSVHLSEVMQNGAANVYLGFLTEARAIIADPILLFNGKVDTSKLTDGVDTATLTILLENILIDFDRPNDLRYNHESQQVQYPGDLFFEYVEQLQDAHFFWGLKKKKNTKKSKRQSGRGG